MASKTDIYNMAILELGISGIIQNGTLNSDNKAIILNVFYETARDDVLKSFDWNFAEKYKELALSTEQSLSPEFSYTFDYPADCLCARDLFVKDGDNQPKKFKLSADSNGQRTILTEVNPCVLRYTRKVENEALFTDEFSSLLAIYLAGLAGKALTGSEQKASSAIQKYKDKVRAARISNAQEGLEVDKDKSTYLDSRN